MKGATKEKAAQSKTVETSGRVDPTLVVDKGNPNT